MAYETDLLRDNPWWQDRRAIDGDAEIAGWERSAVRYDPPLRRSMRYDFEPDNTVIYTLRGPRQVGKTTMIKLQIRDFLGRGVDPWNVFYYSFDRTGGTSGMIDAILGYTRLKKKFGDGEGRTYVFLDEITSVEEWQKGIKWIMDKRMLPNCTVVATGSRAQGIVRAAERLPGRRGRVEGAYDHVLLPMRFAEFAALRDGEIGAFVRGLRERGTAAEVRARLLRGEIPEEADALNLAGMGSLDALLREYLLVGGIPEIVGERARANFIPKSAYSTRLASVAGDWGAKNAERLLAQAGRALVSRLGSGTTWNGLRVEADFTSLSAARDCAAFLEDMSIITVVHRYGKNGAPRIQKEKKIYFQDPFYAHVFNVWADAREDPFAASERFLGDDARIGAMVEGAVASHLVQAAFEIVANKQMFDYANHVMYWRDDRGREADFVLRAGEQDVPVEVKYRNSVRHGELGGLAGFLDSAGTERGVVLSKREIERRRDYSVVPAAVFLALI